LQIRGAPRLSCEPASMLIKECSTACPPMNVTAVENFTGGAHTRIYPQGGGAIPTRANLVSPLTEPALRLSPPAGNPGRRPRGITPPPWGICWLWCEPHLRGSPALRSPRSTLRVPFRSSPLPLRHFGWWWIPVRHPCIALVYLWYICNKEISMDY
jgi:hypothetical protein